MPAICFEVCTSPTGCALHHSARSCGDGRCVLFSGGAGRTFLDTSALTCLTRLPGLGKVESPLVWSSAKWQAVHVTPIASKLRRDRKLQEDLEPTPVTSPVPCMQFESGRCYRFHTWPKLTEWCLELILWQWMISRLLQYPSIANCEYSFWKWNGQSLKLQVASCPDVSEASFARDTQLANANWNLLAPFDRRIEIAICHGKL